MVNAKKARENRRAVVEKNMKGFGKERNWFAIWTSLIAVVAIAAVAITVTAINLSEKEASQVEASTVTPTGTVNDGFPTGKNGALSSTAEPYKVDTPLEASGYDKSLGNTITVFFDGSCSFCEQFEKDNNTQISEWVDNGIVDTVNIHPVAFLGKYSYDAANALACVVEYSPENVFDAQGWLVTNNGSSTRQIVTGLNSVGVEKSDKFTQCVRGGKYNKFVEASTLRAQTGPVPQSTIQKVTGTPTVLVNGERYPGNPGPEAFASFVNHILEGGTTASWGEANQPEGETSTEIGETTEK